MGFLDIINHLLNFVAPAAFVAFWMVLVVRFAWKKKQISDAIIKQFAIIFVVNLAVLVVGLWYFERDGKMATYLAMVLVSAAVQWVRIRGWRP